MAETTTPASTNLTDESEFDVTDLSANEDLELQEDNIDLKPYTLAETIRTQRELALAPDQRQDLSGRLLSLPEVVAEHSKRLGISKAQLNRAAKNQGLDLNVIVTGIGRQGRDVNEIFKELQDLGTVAFDPPESRIEKMREIRRKRLVDQRQVDINKLANKRIDEGKKQFNFSPAELAVDRPQKTVDFTKLKDPSKRQAAVAELVYDMGSDTGFSRDQMIAILANGLGESQLDPMAENPTAEDSHGVWQFNRGGSGEGAGFTVEQLQDPKFQMEQIIKAVSDRDELKGFRDTNLDANQLTLEFMHHFEKPEFGRGSSQKDIEARKRRLSYLPAAKRLFEAAEKNSPKAKNLARITKEKSKQVKRMINEGVTQKFRVSTDSEAPGGDVANEVAKPGSPAYQEIEEDHEITFNPEVARKKGGDVKRARYMQQLMAKYQSGDGGDQIRNLFAEDAFQGLYLGAVNYDKGVAARKLGIDVVEFELRARDPRSREGQIFQEILRANRDQAAKFQTLNKTGVPALVSYEFMDPDNWMGESRTSSDDPYLERIFDAAAGNRVELVGMDKDKIPVFRAQNHLDSVADKLDILLSMGAGALERALRGPEGESIAKALKEGSIQGVRDARNFTKFALSTELARENGVAAVGLGLAGAGVDVFMPDPTIGLAKVASLARKSAKKIAPALRATKIPKALDELDVAATELIETQKLINRAEQEIAAGNYEEGKALLDQAKERALTADNAERNVNSELPLLMREVDRTDGRVAVELARDNNLLTGGKEADDLAKSLGFSDVGLNKDFVHPAFGRIEVRGGGQDQLAQRADFFDMNRKIDRLKDLTTSIQEGTTAKPYIPLVVAGALQPLGKEFSVVLSSRGFTRARKGQPEEVSNAVRDLYDFLGSSRAADMIANDPQQFRNSLEALLGNIPTQRRGKSVMEVLDKDINDAIDNASKIARQSEEAGETVDRAKELSDVIKSVAAIAESRAAGHAITRGAVAADRGIGIVPSIPNVTSRFDEVATNKISAVALDFRNELERAFPALKGDAAMHIARQLDDRLKATALRTNEPLELIFETRDYNKIIPDLRRKQAAETGEATTDVEFAPLRFGEEQLTTREIRELGDDIKTDLEPGMVIKIEDGKLTVRSVELPEQLQKKGIATKLYKAALQRAKNEGLEFTSDANPAVEVERIYDRLMDSGIPIKRVTRNISPGKFETRYTISKDDLAKVSDDLLALTDEADQLTRYKELWLPDFVTESQKAVRAMEEATTVEDFMFEINKIARHELDAKQMEAVTDWLSTKKIKVGFRGSQFTSNDPADIVQAEEAFAKAFSEYVDGLPPPTDKTETAFERVSKTVSDLFFSAKNAKADGARFEPTPEIERVFDSLLQKQAPTNKSAPNLFRALKRALIDDLPKNSSKDFLLSIAKETDRLGSPISVDELQKRVSDAVKRHMELSLKKGEEVSADEIRIELPVPISLGGLLSQTGPKKSFTLAEFSQGALNYGQRKRLADIPAIKNIAADSEIKAIREMTPTQIIDQYLVESGLFSKFVGRTYLGFDALEKMRGLPPEIRDAVLAGSRFTQQSVGDAVALISDGDRNNLYRYLTGDPTVKLKTGRQVFSSGHNHVSDGFNAFANYIVSFAKKNPAGYKELIDYFELGNLGTKASLGDRSAQIAEATRNFVLNDQGSRLIKDIFASLKSGRSLKTSGDTVRPEHLQILESIFYFSGESRRKGKYFEGNSRRQFDAFYSTLNKLFPAKTVKDDPVANRTAVLFAAHGAASKARKEWVNLGIAVDAETAADFKKWIVGEGLETPEQMARVRQAFQVHGYNPRFLEAVELEGLDVWVPKAAREKLALAMEQAIDKTTKERSMDLFERIGSGVTEAPQLSDMAVAFTFRYLKTKMVRGHFLLKTRYFWMNTMDHFNQMSHVVGFRPALVSTMRLIPQTFATNPVMQTALLSVQRAGIDDVGEVMRSALSSAGDAGAAVASAITRAGKWHGSLDAMMEGRPGFVLSGGVPFDHKDLRRIGVEEGLAASFQTAELSTKIRRQGEMFLEDGKKQAGLGKIPFADLARDLAKVAEDLAEGWSERERFGAYLTLVEMGVEPRKAARLVIDALYDYAGSMSPADRNWLIQIFFPFWAFQKNANRQLVDVLFSPRGAYRLGVLRRSYDRQAEFASEVAFQDLVDPLGMNTDIMDDNEVEAYEALKETLADHYGKPVSQLPEDLRRQIRLAITGRSTIFENGRLYRQDAQAEFISNLSYVDPKTGEEIPRFFKGRFPRSLVEKPSRSTMPSWAGTRDAGLLPYAVTEQNKIWHDLMDATYGGDRTYTALMLPEQSYKASANFMMNVTATYFEIGRQIVAGGTSYFMDDIDLGKGGELYQWKYPLLNLLRPESALFVSDAAKMLNVADSGMPYEVAPAMAGMLRSIDLEVLPVDARDDPFKKRLAYSEFKRQLAAGEIQTIPDDPYLDGETLVPEKRYYINGGVAAFVMRNMMPAFDQVNTILKQMEKSQPEELAGLRGDLQRVLRLSGVLDVRDISPDKVARGAGYEKADEVDAKKFLELKQEQDLDYLDQSLFKAIEAVEDPEVRKSLERLKKSDPGDMEIDLE